MLIDKQVYNQAPTLGWHSSDPIWMYVSCQSSNPTEEQEKPMQTIAIMTSDQGMVFLHILASVARQCCQLMQSCETYPMLCSLQQRYQAEEVISA